MYFGIAASDDKSQPDAKDKLKEAFAAANVPAEIEVYAGALHGWCVTDMPLQRMACRPITCRMPSAPGASCWRCIKPGWPSSGVFTSLARGESIAIRSGVSRWSWGMPS